jgi:hypothetical protein
MCPVQRALKSGPEQSRKQPVKKRAALSIFEAEMLGQSVSYDFFPTIDIGKVYLSMRTRKRESPSSKTG